MKSSDELGRIIDSLPESNSHASKDKKTQTSKVVKGKVKKIPESKKSLAKKFAETFIVEDLSTVKDHIIFDYAIPGIKNFIVNSIENAARMIFLGETTSRKSSRGSSRVSYERYYRDKDSSDRVRTRSTDRYSFEDVTYETYGDAEMVLETLTELIDQYGQATVADFYEASGVKTQYTDYNYGWKALGNARVIRIQGGEYELSLPRPKPLDK